MFQRKIHQNSIGGVLKEFRIKIKVSDFTTSTVEKANNKNDAIHRFFCHQKFNMIDENGIKITCEEIPQKSAFQEWNFNTKALFHQKISEYRKEGWNANSDYVKENILTWIQFYGCSQELLNHIDSIKEP